METIDIILLALVLIPGLWQGLRKGFIFQVVTLAVLLVGTWLSYRFSESVARWLGGIIHTDPIVLKILSFVVIFLVVYVVLYALGKLLLRVVKLLLGGWVDKVLGVVFAIVKFALCVGLAVIVFDSLNRKFGLLSAESLGNAPVYTLLKEFASTVCPFIKGLLWH